MGVITDNYNFVSLREFKYLRKIIAVENNLTHKLKNWILDESRCLYSFQDLINSKALTRRTEINLYKIVLRPVVMYSSETWTVINAN